MILQPENSEYYKLLCQEYNEKKLRNDIKFLKLARFVALDWSKDPSTKVGCVVATDDKRYFTGYNGFPAGIKDTEERLNNKEVKYKLTIHAEINAIRNALVSGVSVENCTIYTWPFSPCVPCAMYIIQNKIKRVVAPSYTPERWKQSFEEARNYFKEAGVQMEFLDLDDDHFTNS